MCMMVVVCVQRARDEAVQGVMHGSGVFLTSVSMQQWVRYQSCVTQENHPGNVLLDGVHVLSRRA